MRFAQRLQSFQAYLGTEVNARLTQMRLEGRDIINLGLGDPDVTPPPHLLEAFQAAAGGRDNHHYPSHYPDRPLREAIAAWYERRFAVQVDPATEVLPLLGSSEGLFVIHLCLLDPGETALVPDPCYPSYVAGVQLAGGAVYPVPLRRENGFLPDLEAIPSAVAERARMLWVNYPNNPTAAVAPAGFYPGLIAWAARHQVIVVHDNPYSEIAFDGYRAPSFLQFPGAKELGVEFHSLSKSYNCCGWRSGMLVGNREVIAAMAKVKSHTDRGMAQPVRLASIAALEGPVEFMQERNAEFRRRREVVVAGLRAAGLEAETPRATFYVWSTVPAGFTSRDFCFKALDAAGVWMIPGSMYGAQGEGYLRIALTQPVERLAEAMTRLGELVR